MPRLPAGFQRLFLALTGAAIVFGISTTRPSRKSPSGSTHPISAHATRPAREAASLSVVTPASAAGETSALFRYVDPRDRADLSAALPAPAREIHYVALNREFLAGKHSPFWEKSGEGRIELPLPDGTMLTVAIDSSEMLGPDRFISRGRIPGRPQSLALFASSGGFLHASIEDPDLGKYALRAATADLSQFYRIEPSLVPPCGGEWRPARAAGISGTAAGDIAPAALAADNPQHAEVHVLMVYTQAVLPTLSGAARRAAIQSAFDLAIAKVNTAFEASLITARVKLVGIAETNYDEEASAVTNVQDDALTALYKTDDGKMDEIHALRDQVGADIVCLALGRRDSANSGLSFLLDSPYQNENPDYAFSVVQYTSVTGTNVVPHELGHVLGCAHDRENALSGAGAYSYSYGYRFFGADGRQYHDIMSYPPGMELSYFSNPSVVVPLPVNVPIGVAPGRPGESNTAQTIENTAFAVAQFRLQTQAPAAAGTLINVATRAYVGTGDQVLIGGFVVDGREPKQLLVRAAGPALGTFGIGNALADPVLRIFGGAQMQAENDNWASPVGDGRAAAASEIATVAARVQAFPFASGSRDAALLVTLPPGAYTAVVEGARGATGTGLIEAYDVGGGDSRVLALATRGYVDRNGRELYAGFVIQAEPGATKRVLIRVLGPTLARAPFAMAGVLDDPELELRSAAGETLIQNDDWSSGAEGGAGTENDFKPLVRSYGEEHIYATGHAPTNRREPCVLVDLPGGAYSVIVRPFEFQSDNPLRDQPASPGVAVVEVYEVGR